MSFTLLVWLLHCQNWHTISSCKNCRHFGSLWNN